MWDTWELSILSAISTVCGLLSLLWLMVSYVKRRRYRFHVQRRMYRYVRRRKAKRWTCRKCGYHGTGPAPMGPVCQGCWHALDEYLQEVA